MFTSVERRSVAEQNANRAKESAVGEIGVLSQFEMSGIMQHAAPDSLARDPYNLFPKQVDVLGTHGDARARGGGRLMYYVCNSLPTSKETGMTEDCLLRPHLDPSLNLSNRLLDQPNGVNPMPALIRLRRLQLRLGILQCVQGVPHMALIGKGSAGHEAAGKHGPGNDGGGPKR
jgi:hypothetical protein